MQLPYCKRIGDSVLRELDAVNACKVISKLRALHPSANQRALPEQIPAFITWSPVKNQMQGGANGIGVYSEVHPAGDEASEARQVAAVLLHELLHLTVSPKTWLIEAELKETPELFREKRKWVYGGRDGLARLMEEAIVLAVANVICFAEPVAGQMEYYESLSKIEPDGQAATLAIIWSIVSEIESLMRAYLQDNADKTSIHTALIDIAVRLAIRYELPG